ncbi:MAG: hypothetical protein U1D00_34675 [Mycobacterium sp.]|nr:hypothetical protein [Mycobacterium sp.]
MATLPATRPARARAYNTSLAIATTTILALQALTDRALTRPRDAGDVVEKVIMVAGLAVAAIAAVAYFRPVIERYMHQVR